MTEFIAENDFIAGNVAMFGTSGGNAGIEVDLMAAALKREGATALGSYYCKGKAFLFSTKAARTRKTWSARESSPERW